MGGLQGAHQRLRTALKTPLSGPSGGPISPLPGIDVRSRGDSVPQGRDVTFPAHAALLAAFTGTAKLKEGISLH
ncbi:hypothetical protein GCM10027259_33900 [Micromonospora palomenae]